MASEREERAESKALEMSSLHDAALSRAEGHTIVVRGRVTFMRFATEADAKKFACWNYMAKDWLDLVARGYSLTFASEPRSVRSERLPPTPDPEAEYY